MKRLNLPANVYFRNFIGKDLSIADSNDKREVNVFS